MTSPDAAVPSPSPPLDANGLPDFTVRREFHSFRVDDDVFTAPGTIGGYQIRKIGQLHSEFALITDFAGETDHMIFLVSEMFKVLLPGADGRLFAERMMSDGDPGDPFTVAAGVWVLGMDQAIPILYFLLERYGLRPTVPSSPSLSGSTAGLTDGPSDGTSSTAGASLAASST